MSLMSRATPRASCLSVAVAAALSLALSARGRASGIPRLQWHDDAAWLVWTDVAGDVPGLHGARVRWP